MTNVQNKQENVPTYIKLYDDLLSATHYRSLTTGTSIKLTSSAKLVYAKMKSRFEYFKSNGKGYYDTQDDIADATGLSRKGVNTILQDFHANGIVVIELNGRNNVYTAINSLDFCDKGQTPKKAPESVSPTTLHPRQKLEEFVEPEALVERYSKPVEVIEKVAEEDDGELDWEEESEVVFVDEMVSVVRMEKYNNNYTYGQDYFPDYPKSPYDQHGKVSDEFKAWLMKLGGELTCDTYFEFEGDFYRIPRC